MDEMIGRYQLRPQAEGADLQIFLQCAPMLTARKPACILTVTSEQVELLMTLAKGRGITVREAGRVKEKNILFLYDRMQLEPYLKDRQVIRFLKWYGYAGAVTEDYVGHLMERYSAYVCKEGIFPHEVGVFLGYPLKDVKGFILNAGKRYRMSGYWKVYSNVRKAKRLFAIYDKAKAQVLNGWQKICYNTEKENELVTVQMENQEGMCMATPHNEANQGEIAKVVLMPGDPLRAKFIADHWLTEVRQVNTVRNMFAYTGMYKGSEITVMGSGMGMPSIGIYSYELFNVYGVEAIIRVGSAGAYTDHLDLFDVVLASECFSETTFAKVQNGTDTDRMYPSKELNAVIMEAAKAVGVPVRETCIHSSDVFYAESNVDGYQEIFRKHGCECVEMESYALFHNANVLHKKAACLLTISDCFPSGANATAKERQNAFTHMMEVALEAARNIVI